MDAFRLLRQQAIESLSAADQDTFAANALGMWERLANRIVALVGEAGFESLFARSVYLAQATYAWLPEPMPAGGKDRGYGSLTAQFLARPPQLANEANRLLLSIFTDTLASLIGGALTQRVLNSAWGDLAHATTHKEKSNGQ